VTHSSPNKEHRINLAELSVSSPGKGEDEGEGPYTARIFRANQDSASAPIASRKCLTAITVFRRGPIDSTASRAAVWYPARR
jgi:hypothetical protein